MKKIAYIYFFVCLSSLMAITNENSTQIDRETSFRKSIDTFAEVDQKVVSGVKKFKQMFINGEFTGQVRSIYAGYNQKNTITNTYATALGGMLKYELANFNGFHAGVALSGSQDLSFATGDTLQSKQNDELSSASGSYGVVSEAYINYAGNNFNIRLGRQMIDTPLADSDDIRMISNTFEAYMFTYDVEGFTFTLGNVQKWQGIDAGLGYIGEVKQNSSWLDTDTTMIGLTHNDVFKLNAWYYDIQKKENASGASYFELGYHELRDGISVHASVQYLHESEMKNSGVRADIYGGVVEVIGYGAGINIAYNKSKKHQGKRSFSGIGGGSLYTSMDTMILDEIADDRDASALVLGLEYNMKNLRFLYAYGDFDGEEDTAGIAAHIVEQNFGVEYTLNNVFTLASIYVKQEDKHNPAKTQNDWDRIQVMLAYNF